LIYEPSSFIPCPEHLVLKPVLCLNCSSEIKVVAHRLDQYQSNLPGAQLLEIVLENLCLAHETFIIGSN